jgi:threonine/homoserine/homoserine lactone efflux protein
MDWGLLPRGLVIGVSVAAPVGPMAILCLRRTLAQGRLMGFVSGLGVATADGCYGAIAAFGLTSISTLLVDQADWVRIIGGLFLIYLGVTTASSTAPAQGAIDSTRRPADRLKAFGSTLGLTLTNPTTILSFVAIFAGFGLADDNRGTGSAAALVIGVFVGSAVWWLTITTAVAMLRGWFTAQRLTWINRASGALIAVFGLLAIVSFAKDWV